MAWTRPHVTSPALSSCDCEAQQELQPKTPQQPHRSLMLPRNFSLQQAKSHTLFVFLTRTDQLTDLHGRPELAPAALEERLLCRKERAVAKRTTRLEEIIFPVAYRARRLDFTHRLNCCRDPTWTDGCGEEHRFLHQIASIGLSDNPLQRSPGTRTRWRSEFALRPAADQAEPGPRSPTIRSSPARLARRFITDTHVCHVG